MRHSPHAAAAMKKQQPMEWPYLIIFFFLLLPSSSVHALGSMSSGAAAYGRNGPAFCSLRTDRTHIADCFGADMAVFSQAPLHLPFLGLAAGENFVCGLTLSTPHMPYCWGNSIYVQAGIPHPKGPNISYDSISAGDNHLCALRSSSYTSSLVDPPPPSVDCWGYNMTGSFVRASLLSITAGSLFVCGLFASNRTATCWGDNTGSGVISKIPRLTRFESISAGGYHVCGILLASRRTLCWGRSLGSGVPGNAIFSLLVGGKFHACGLLATNHRPLCWGLINLPASTPVPNTTQFLSLVAGDYYTCGITAVKFRPICWGSQYPSALPSAISPLLCSALPCETGKYELALRGFSENSVINICKGSKRLCIPCTQGCPDGMYESVPCGPNGDRQCSVNCTLCSGSGKSCSQECTPKHHPVAMRKYIIVGELSVAVVVVSVIMVTAYVWLRYRLSKSAATSLNEVKDGQSQKQPFRPSFIKHNFTYEIEEPKLCRAENFSFEELEKATAYFGKESEVGKGSFSCVYRGVLSDGRVVAVKRAVVVANKRRDAREFHNELDLLSRLNHIHLLNLLGFCDDGKERLLVYEFMANGTLHEQLHGKAKGQLSWVRRVTIAVQAARGLEYLHGYARPPVIHRDIKSSNILLDDEWNARVSDFGLSLLGPLDSDSPISELPAGTLGYLDPEYYKLHYLSTKSDVYSFGVLLLEILSGRKAIDMHYEEGNIVQWAVPLIKAGDVSSILDPRLEPPANSEAMQKIAKVAARCVRMRGKDRPSMDKVTTALERAVAVLLMGSQVGGELILPSEVVLGSRRLHRKRQSAKSVSGSEASDAEGHYELRVPSSITFPSISSSQRRKSFESDLDTEAKQRTEDQLLDEFEAGAHIDLPHDIEIHPVSPPQQPDENSCLNY